MHECMKYGFSFDDSSRAILDALRTVTKPAAGATGYPATMANTISHDDFLKATILIEMREQRSVLPMIP